METITLTISARTLNAIGVGLRELPYKVAVEAITEIDSQVKAYLENRSVTERSLPPGPPNEIGD